MRKFRCMPLPTLCAYVEELFSCVEVQLDSVLLVHA